MLGMLRSALFLRRSALLFRELTYKLFVTRTRIGRTEQIYRRAVRLKETTFVTTRDDAQPRMISRLPRIYPRCLDQTGFGAGG